MQVSSIKGNVAFADAVRPAEISVDLDSGLILSVDALDRVEAASTILFPGFVDLHVHAREYPEPEGDPAAVSTWEALCRKETFQTAGRAAINGGVTLFAAMPNDPVPPDNAERYEAKRKLIASSPCPVILFAAASPTSEPWADIPYKVYLDDHPSSFGFTSWKDLGGALARFRGCRVFFHAEDPDLLKKTGTGPRWKTRPPQAEIAAVEKILDFTARHGLITHICHLSVAKSVRLIEEFNSTASQKVTCEVTPHHLFFGIRDGSVRTALGSKVPHTEAYLLECNPPIRSEDDRRYLLQALRDGRIDMVATDHAPHTLEDKRNGSPGMPHLDTVGAFAGWLMKKCRFTPSRIAAVLSQEPAKKLAVDLACPHGTIEAGSAASFTVLDLSEVTEIEQTALRVRGPLETRCGWSPFAGCAFPASVAKTIVRGKTYSFPADA
jgi:dihydroorotase